MRNLRPRGEAQGSARARLVQREAFVGGAGATEMLLGQEAIGAAADDFGDRLERRVSRQTLRHDRGDVASRSGQSLGQVRKRTLQMEPYGAIVGRR
jgi:hypothetical protein